MKYQSDILIDKFINEIIFKNKKDGFFVEIGSLDGIIFSNSYIFEKYLNWNGICVEPDKRWHEEITNNRKCNLSFNAISDNSNKIVEFCLHKSGGESFVKSEQREWIYDSDVIETIQVETKTLTDLLDEHTKLITSETYGKNNYGKIPSNGKQKTTVADSMNTDLKQLNNTNSETYILGSIALASLVILTLYL